MSLMRPNLIPLAIGMFAAMRRTTDRVRNIVTRRKSKRSATYVRTIGDDPRTYHLRRLTGARSDANGTRSKRQFTTYR